MTDLFDGKDILTVATADQAVVGTNGFFSDSLIDLAVKIKRGDVGTLLTIFTGQTYCFKNKESSYIFFLPVDKAKKFNMYRPFNGLDELFDFLFIDFSKDNVYDPDEKAELLLGKKIILKNRSHDSTKAIDIHDVEFNGTGSDVFINRLSLIYLFNNFEIKKDDEFVPFGIKDE